MQKSNSENLPKGVPRELNDRLKLLAEERGENVNALLETVLGDFVEQQGELLPTAGTIVGKLRDNAAKLREVGISHLALSGSVARGESARGCAIKLLVEYIDGDLPGWYRSDKIEKCIQEALESDFEIDLMPAEHVRRDLYDARLIDAMLIF